MAVSPAGMRARRSTAALAVVALAVVGLLHSAAGDSYIQNPRGSNDKLNEESNNRQNANRLFDSQNNAQAGYQVGDNCDGVCQSENGRYDKSMPGAGEGVMYYYPESVLYIEWTHQHGSGMDKNNPNVHSEVVLQYMCNDDVRRPDSSGQEIAPFDRFQTGVWGHNHSTSLGIRDGTVTDTIPDDPEEYIDPQYGMHESYGYYQDCKTRERNKGLWTADQSMNDNVGARSTRQNRNGQRYAFECPEERDYYPYWHPTPWKDIAVLTSDMNRCKYYQEASENVQGRNYCVDMEANNQEACIEPPINSRWEFRDPHGLPPPECAEIPYSRDNHHGNGGDGFPLNFNWTLPRAEEVFRGVSEDVQELTCVLRLRYNISSGEGYNLGWSGDDAMLRGTTFVDLRFNGPNSPVKTDPLDDWIGLGHNTSGPLRLAINTAQTGRTFQDRTHKFTIRRRPRELEGKKIYNLNVRGRRGNIEQVYPAVEYDFAPANLVVDNGDYIHYQWTGSDANANNAGEGRQRTDRSNIVQYDDQDSNMPSPIFFFDEFGERTWKDNPLFIGSNGEPDATIYARMAFLNQTDCDPCYFAPGPRCEDFGNRPTNNGNAQNDLRNCAVLNRAPAYFDGGVHKAHRPGVYRIMSTRNNNFSNRSQKGRITVLSRNIIPIVVGSVLGGLALLVGGAAAIMAFMPLAAASGTAIASAAGASATTGGATGGAASGGATSAVGRLGCGVCACCAVLCTPLALASARLNERWRRFSVGFRASVFLGLVCFLIAFAGFARNSDGLTFPNGVFYPLAKAGGYLLDFAMTLILFPMMRNLVSWLRTTPITEWIPLDDNHSLHILAAKIVALGTVVHVLGHYLFMHWKGSYETAYVSLPGITGHLALVAMLLMYITSVCRKGWRVPLLGWRIGSFDAFWFTHQLYLAVYLLLVLHAEAFYKWAFWPLLLFGIDKAIHYLRGKKECQLLAVRQEAKGTDVMSLQMRVFLNGRLRFRYRCGQYLMLQCPALGKEWHPFTITSAPEQDYVSVHIRCRGDWTKALQAKLNPEGLPLVQYRPVGSNATDGESAKYPVNAAEQPCEIKVDGPYGSGSDRTDEYDTVMLVGTGIGVTPFASVMKSLKIRADRESNVRPAKVYFYWVCRDQKEFDWFSWLIEELSNLGDRFELNTYLTGELDLDQMIKQHTTPDGYQDEETRALMDTKSGRGGSRKSRNAVGQSEAVEMVQPSGTKWAGKKWAGRPDWRRIFKEQSKAHAGEEIGVFLCGPGAAELQAMCNKNSTADTAFVFHKEVF